jgi:hypothetical protein
MNQVKEPFSFDLQMFADEGGAPATEPEPTSTTTTETHPQSTEQPAETPPQSKPTETEQDSPIDYSDLGKAKNPTDQLAFLKEHGFIGKEETPVTPPEAENTTVEEPPAKDGQATEQPTVTDEPMIEIKVNGEIKKVKQSEAVELAQKGLDYARKTQELADQRRQLDILLQEQITQQAKQQTAQPQKPGQQAEAEYRTVVAQTEKQLGLQPGEFNQFDPVHAFELQKVTLQHNSAQLVKQQVGQRLQTFVQAAKSDPVAQQVDANFDTYLFKMGAEGADSAKKAAAILSAKQKFFAGHATMQDLDVLEAHWNYVKTALTAAIIPAPKAKPVVQPKETVIPPKTEAPGSSVEPPRTRLDYKKVGHMKQSDQLATLRKAGILKRG